MHLQTVSLSPNLSTRESRLTTYGSAIFNVYFCLFLISSSICSQPPQTTSADKVNRQISLLAVSTNHL